MKPTEKLLTLHAAVVCGDEMVENSELRVGRLLDPAHQLSDLR